MLHWELKAHGMLMLFDINCVEMESIKRKDSKDLYTSFTKDFWNQGNKTEKKKKKVSDEDYDFIYIFQNLKWEFWYTKIE